MTLQELLDECRNNINSEVVFQEIVKEHDKQIRKETLNELWKRAIYMHDEYVEYEELDNIIDEMLKEQNK